MDRNRNQSPPAPFSSSHQIMSLGPTSAVMMCPACRNSICTRTQSTPSCKTHIIAICLCLLGCWPCVIIPYCMNSCQVVTHFCPYCNACLGTYKF